METFDWQAFEEQLLVRSQKAILQFAAEHPEVVCSFFAYDTNPIYGEFLVSFETAEHSLQEARTNERRAMERRNKMLSHPWSWKGAKYFSSDPAVTDYSPDVGYFAYHMYADIGFEELNALGASDDYPQNEETENNYIEGNVRISLWKVVERLIITDSFSPLTLASPFRVGYQFHDEGLTILRILNWPHVL